MGSVWKAIGYNDRLSPRGIAVKVCIVRRSSPGQATLTYLLSHRFPGIRDTRHANPSTGIQHFDLHLLFQKLYKHKILKQYLNQEIVKPTTHLVMLTEKAWLMSSPPQTRAYPMRAHEVAEGVKFTGIL